VTNNGSSSPISSNSAIPTTQRSNRRYKTQLRDFLSTCRSKRKVSQTAQQTAQITSGNQLSSPPTTAVVDYIPDPVAVAYTNLNPIYSTSPVPYPGSSTENLYMSHGSSFYPTAENLFHQYRIQSGYYHHPSEYHHHPSSYHVPNGFLAYESYGLATPHTKDEKWHDEKFYNNDQLSNGRNIYSTTSAQQPVIEVIS
jgi:aryl hydrocarbon receptor